MPAATIGRLSFDPSSLVLFDGGEIVTLAPLPARILAELVLAGGNVVPGAKLREALWNDAPIEERNLNQQIYVLRKALRRDPRVCVENVPRRGYRLVVAPEPGVAKPYLLPRRLALAAGALALAALLAGAPRSRLDTPMVSRDLTLADYYAASEGPHHLDRAASAYRDAIESDPFEAAGFGGLAMVDAKEALAVVGRRRTVEFETARRYAGSALRLDPEDSNALTALGIVASVDDRRPDVAQRVFDAAVASDPTAESPRVWRAKFRLSVGDFKAAGCDLRTLSHDVPTSGYALGSLGEWLVLDRDYPGASSVLSEALDLGNHPGFTRYWLARSYYWRGLEPQALTLANQVLALYPGEPSALALRLRIEVKLGDMRAAQADFRRIEGIRDPRQVDPIALASADVAMGRRAQALDALQRYVVAGAPDLDALARMRTDPDFDTLRSGFNSPVML